MQEDHLKHYMRYDTRRALEHAAKGLYVLLALLGLLVLFLGRHAEAKTVYYGKAPVAVKVASGVPTLFRFGKEVKNILRGQRFTIKPASEESPNYAILSVEPRFSQGSSDVLYLLADGSTVTVRQIIVPESASADSEYTFTPKDDEPEPSANAEEASPNSGSPDVSLLKAMIRGDQVNGYRLSAMNRSLELGLKADAELIRLYQGQDLTGFVIRLKNSSYTRELAVDVRNLSIGRKNLAVLSQIDSATLSPRGKPGAETYLRVVAKSGATSSALIVPMQEASKGSTERSTQ